jgi:hypothetical protein
MLKSNRKSKTSQYAEIHKNVIGIKEEHKMIRFFETRKIARENNFTHGAVVDLRATHGGWAVISRGKATKRAPKDSTIAWQGLGYDTRPYKSIRVFYR